MLLQSGGSGQRPDSYQPRATPWVSVGFCSVAGQRPASQGASGQTRPNPDAASRPASIPRHNEPRFQRSAWSLPVKPRALPWAGMNDAVGVSNRPAVPPEQLPSTAPPSARGRWPRRRVCGAPAWAGTGRRSQRSRTPSRTVQATVFSRRRLRLRLIFWSVPTPSLWRCPFPVTAYTGSPGKRG